MDASAISYRLIGALIVEKGLITEPQLEHALEEQQATGARLGEILMEQFGVTRAALESALTAQRAENQSLGAEEDSEANAAVRELARMLDEWGRNEATPKRPIGEIFVERGFITSGQLEDALEEQKFSGRKLGEILVSQGKLSRLRLWDALEDQAASFGPGTAESPPPTGPAPQLRVVADALSDQVRAHESNVEMWKPKMDQTIESLQARVEQVEQASAEPGENVTDLRDEITALVARLDALPQPSDEWRDALSELGGRVDDLVDGSSESQSTLQRLAEQLEAERAAERELDAQVNALAQRVDQLAGELTARLQQVTDSVTTAASREQAEALRRDLDALRATLDSLPAPTGAVDELSGRVDELGENVAARLQHVTDSLAGAATREQAERLRRELDDLRASLDALPAPTDHVEALARRVDQLSESFSVRLQQVAEGFTSAAGREETEALRHDLESLRAAFDSLPPVPAADYGELAGRVGKLDEELRARLQHVTEQLAGAATRDQADRLRRELDDVRATLDALPAPTDDLETLTRRVEQLSDNFSARLQHVAESVSGAANREQAEALRRDLDALRSAVETIPTPTDEWREAVNALAVRLDELAFGSTEARSTFEHLTSRLDATDDDDRHRDERMDSIANVADELNLRLQQLSEGLADAPTHDQTDTLRRELEELRGRVEALPVPTEEWREAVAALAVQMDSAQTSEEWRDAVAALAVRLDEVAAPSEQWRAELGSLFDHLRGRVDRLEHDVAVAASAEGIEAVSSRVGELSEGLERTGGRLDQIARRLEGLAPLHRVEELADATTETATAHGAALDAVREELAAQARKAQEAAEKRRSDKAAARERLDALEASLADTTAWSSALEPLQAQLSDLEHRLSELASTPAAARREELDALREEIHRSLDGTASAHDESLQPLQTQLAALDRRLSELTSTQDAVRHADLDSLRKELHRALDGTSSAHSDALEPLRNQLAELDHRLSELASRQAAERRAELDSLREEMHRYAADAASAQRETLGAVHDELAAAIAEASASSSALEPLQAHLAELDHRLSELASTQAAERSAELAALRDELHQTAAGAASAHAEALEAVRGELAEHSHRADEAAAARRADTDALNRRLEQFESSLDEHAAGHDAERRADLDALRAELYQRVEQVAATSAGRSELDALRQQMEAEFGDLLERHGQDGAAAEATGQAIRDGLAELARRLTASEHAYFESGRTLRHSIEGLGLAITDADWHLRTGAEADPNDEATSYVAFVPAGDAYRLVECDGPPPYLGQIVEIDGFEEVMLRVSRLGRSPLPFDGRPCAYLERLSA